MISFFTYFVRAFGILEAAAQDAALSLTPVPTPLGDAADAFGPSSVDFTYLFLKMIFAMVFVIALALVLIKYVVPRMTARRSKIHGTDIEILDRIPLDPKKYLCLLEVEGRRLLIGVSDNHIGMVAELDSTHAKDKEPN